MLVACYTRCKASRPGLRSQTSPPIHVHVRFGCHDCVVPETPITHAGLYLPDSDDVRDDRLLSMHVAA